MVPGSRSSSDVRERCRQGIGEGRQAGASVGVQPVAICHQLKQRPRVAPATALRRKHRSGSAPELARPGVLTQESRQELLGVGAVLEPLGRRTHDDCVELRHCGGDARLVLDLPPESRWSGRDPSASRKSPPKGSSRPGPRAASPPPRPRPAPHPGRIRPSPATSPQPTPKAPRRHTGDPRPRE